MVDITKKVNTQRIAEAKSTMKVDRDLYEILFYDNLLFKNLWG